MQKRLRITSGVKYVEGYKSGNFYYNGYIKGVGATGNVIARKYSRDNRKKTTASEPYIISGSVK